MDLEIDLSALQSKSSDFDSMNSNVKTICEDCNSSYLKKLSGTEIIWICFILGYFILPNLNESYLLFVNELFTIELGELNIQIFFLS